MTEINPAQFLQNRTDHTAQGDRLAIQGLLAAEGVAVSTDFHVSQQTVADMSVRVSQGHGYIFGTEDAHQGTYHVYNDGLVSVDVDASSPTLTRIDLIVARVYDEFYSGDDNHWALEVVTGLAAGTPSVPNLPDNSIEVARITVGPGVTTITDSDIDTSNKPVMALRSSVPAMLAYSSAGSTTWNKPEGLRAIRVRLVGGGGSGGGCQSTSSGQQAEGGGGGGGGYAEKFLLAAELSSTETVTVGAGGTAATPGLSGSTGGPSSFGSHVTAFGGTGGSVGTATSGNSTPNGGNGGGTSGADVSCVGSDGGAGRVQGGLASKTAHGGSSVLGGTAISNAHPSNGRTGRRHGGGSSGASNGASASSRGSTAGHRGVVIIDHYF